MYAFSPFQLRLPCADTGSYRTFRAVSAAEADQRLPAGAGVDFVLQFYVRSIPEDAAFV